jgi:hypothetical protein
VEAVRLHLRQLGPSQRIDLDQAMTHAEVEEAAHRPFEVALRRGRLVVHDRLQGLRVHQRDSLVAVLAS